jgi:Zn-dependent protease with chaperone function
MDTVPEMGATPPEFTPEEVERARRYHRPLYVAFLADLSFGFLLLAILSFTSVGDWLYEPVEGLPWWGAAPAFTALLIAVSTVVRLPLSFWRSYLHEKQWGFSTQGLPGWLADRAKGLAVGVTLTSGMMLAFVGLARAAPRWWPAVTAPAAALLVLFLSFIAPVLLEPIFNRFTPLSDEELAADLRTLADRAGVPVRDVLVSDASRRTRKENAYVSGLGGTRRVVVFDTLLARGAPRHVTLVVAHELGHRRLRHVLQGTVVAMAGMAGGIVVLWALLRNDSILRAIGASAAGDPRVIPFILLVAAGLQVLAMPFESVLSRRWETDADRFSLLLTRDLPVFEESFRALARSNLSDLDPPRLLYLVAFSHPTPVERISNGRKWWAEMGATALPVTEQTPPTTG